MKRIIFLAVFLLIIAFYGRSLNPFSDTMFVFHDETQPARIQQFILNLKNLQIPPRVAQDFSFGLRYPVFNFYAPASYWITSLFSLTGIDIVSALKLSLLLSIIVGFIAMYLFLKEYFDFFPSLTGAVFYVSSLYYPLDIFIRGNLGEVWFLALFPLSLFFLEKNAKKPSQISFFILVIVLSLLFTVHNLLSMVSILIVFGFIVLRNNKKINFSAFILGLLLSSYFILPLIMENRLTYATYVATQTNYADHFVCPYQLWQSPWGYGGSIKGCNDGMSFKIGKLQLIFALMGIVIFIKSFQRLNHNKHKKNLYLIPSIFYLFLTVFSLFMTTYLSKPIWDLFSPILSLFQFPWRFIAFSLLGLAFFAGYFFHNVKFPFKNTFQILLILFVIGITAKYFTGKFLSKSVFEEKFLSQEYIEKKAAFQIPEYLPRTADYETWRRYEKIPFKMGAINIHYFPFWNIKVNGKTIIPTQFDELGRPMMKIEKGAAATIQVVYQETPVEKLGNFITLLTFAVLLSIIKSKKLWKRLTN